MASSLGIMASEVSFTYNEVAGAPETVRGASDTVEAIALAESILCVATASSWLGWNVYYVHRARRVSSLHALEALRATHRPQLMDAGFSVGVSNAPSNYTAGTVSFRPHGLALGEFALEHNRHHASTVALLIQGEIDWDPEEYHYWLQQWPDKGYGLAALLWTQRPRWSLRHRVVHTFPRRGRWQQMK
jgi:hypothetical protein